MKILMLTPYLPYPLLSGGQTRSYNLLKNLAKNHEITLFSFIRSSDEMKHREELLKYCHKVECFLRRPAWSPINIIRTGFSSYPFLVSIYLSREIKKSLEKELRQNKYDLIHAETFYVMPNLPPTSVPILLVEQTIEYKVYQHFVEHSVSFFLRPFLWIDVRKVRYWETYFWKKSDIVVAMSGDDKVKMKRIIPNLEVHIVPNGVDADDFAVQSHRKKSKPTVLYVGNFKWLQNQEAATILIRDVWPRIKRAVPNARLLVVGRGKTEYLKQIAGHDVEFDEMNDDIRTAYCQADCLLAPIKGPGGTRLKILEAMASGCPVITTPTGIEGIEARDGIEVLVGSTDEELADHAIAVLQQKNLAYGLISHAKKLVKEKYNWQDITKKLHNIYELTGNK